MGILSYLARRFVAGETRQKAMEVIVRLSTSSISATVDVLGEEVQDVRQAEKACQEYVDLLEAMFEAQINSHVSLKLTQMGLALSEDVCLSLMKQILKTAQRTNSFVRVDMEGSRYTEQTLHIFQKLFSQYSNAGIVLQAYLHRSERDAKELARLKAPVRVCKGAYKESSFVALQDMFEIRRNFTHLVEILLQGGSKVAIATHDEHLIQWTLAWMEREHVSREQCEFQMLYGIGRKRARELAQMGYAVRTYVPYGTHWLPYFLRRLRERKENVLFVVQNLLRD